MAVAILQYEQGQGVGKLKDAACRAAKPGPKLIRMPDGQGLTLEVRPSGSKTWTLFYRVNEKGTYKTLGRYPEMGLAAARIAAEELRVGVRQGHDPRGPKAAPDGSDMFQTVARQWFEANRGGWVRAHADRVWSRLERESFPDLGEKGIRTITAPDVLANLRKMEAAGTIDSAKRQRQVIQAVFTFAIASGLADHNPALGLTAALKRTANKRHFGSVPPEQMAWFLARWNRANMPPEVDLPLRLLIHTATRTSDVRGATWDEIGKDRWTISAARMKMRRDHVIPLTPQARDILDRMRKLATGPKLTSISRDTMLRRVQSVTGKDWRDPEGEPATPHGFRATFKTAANDSELWRDGAIERSLAHVERDAVQAAYNRSKFWTERVRLMTWWSDWLTAAEAEGMAKSSNLTGLLE